MAEFITFVSGKGGVGKTVLTSGIGAALSEMGKRVLLIDMDMGFRNLDIALGMENDIVYDKIIFNAFDKARICKAEGIDILIDDSIKLCEEAKNVGIKAIVFNSIVNKNRETKLKRVNNWKDLEKII